MAQILHWLAFGFNRHRTFAHIGVVLLKIHLVRHGQANAGGGDYDQLSELGFSQATVLGKRLRENGSQIRALLLGDLRRHRETAAAFQEGYDSSLPIQIDARLNEIDPDRWKSIALELARSDQSIASLLEKYKDDPSRRRRRLAAITSRVLQNWVLGRSPDYLEFAQNVLQAVTETREADTLIVSSGTPIAIVLAHATSGDQSAVLHWLRQLGNTSHSILDIGRQGIYPGTINSLEHLCESQRTLI